MNSPKESSAEFSPASSPGAVDAPESRDGWWVRFLKWLARGAEKSRNKASGCFT